MSDFGQSVPIERHKAAIRRGEPSLPLKCLLRDGLITRCRSLFDFGCGHGEDIGFATQFGIESTGWDPAFSAEAEKSAADIVSLSYVLNVIEDIPERAETLRESWGLAQRVLVVSARIVVGSQGDTEVEFGDGILTRIGTFQKFYTQAELRGSWIGEIDGANIVKLHRFSGKVTYIVCTEFESDRTRLLSAV